MIVKLSPLLSPLLPDLEDYLKTRWGCHSVILYGSHVSGDASPESDLDFVGFSDVPETAQDVTVFRDIQLDGWFYQTDRMLNPADFLHTKDGYVLFQRENLGEKLLTEARLLWEKGPEKRSKEEKEALRVWVGKMLKRAARGDPEGNFRFHWLLSDSLEIYCKLRDLWYPGPKKMLQWLKTNDSTAFNLCSQAFKPGADLSDVEKAASFLIRKNSDF